eukprot:sb/3479695/
MQYCDENSLCKDVYTSLMGLPYILLCLSLFPYACTVLLDDEGVGLCSVQVKTIVVVVFGGLYLFGLCLGVCTAKIVMWWQHKKELLEAHERRKRLNAPTSPDLRGEETLGKLEAAQCDKVHCLLGNWGSGPA